MTSEPANLLGFAALPANSVWNTNAMKDLAPLLQVSMAMSWSIIGRRENPPCGYGVGVPEGGNVGA